MLRIFATRPYDKLREPFLKLGVETVYSRFRQHEKPQRIKAFVADFVEAKPDVFWFMKDEWLKPKLLHKLKQKCPRTKFIMWYGDQRGAVPALIYNRRKFIDMLFVNNEDKKQQTMYRKVGIQHIKPFYPMFYPTTFAKNVKPTSAIVFGGNNFRAGKFPLGKFRLDVIKALHEQFNLKLYGNGWPIKAEKFIQDRVEYNRALHRSKITLGLNHYKVAQYYDRRIFDCLSVGRLHLTHYIPKMELDFENHKHLVWFKTIPECVKLAKYYLAHGKERDRIGLAGLSKLRKEHSIDARVQQFVNNLAVLKVYP